MRQPGRQEIEEIIVRPSDSGNLTNSSYADVSGWTLTVPKDGYYSVREALVECVAERYSLVLTNGGTGIADRDETPEATKSVIDKEIVGISEEIRRQGLKDTPTAILTRGVAGISNTTLIVNLPGNPDGALSAFRAIKPAIYHALELIEKQISDCKESKYTKNS